MEESEGFQELFIFSQCRQWLLPWLCPLSWPAVAGVRWSRRCRLQPLGVNLLHLQLDGVSDVCLLARSPVTRVEEPAKHAMCIPAPPREKVWMLVDLPHCSPVWTNPSSPEPGGQRRCQTGAQPCVAHGFQGTEGAPVRVSSLASTNPPTTRCWKPSQLLGIALGCVQCGAVLTLAPPGVYTIGFIAVS